MKPTTVALFFDLNSLQQPLDTFCWYFMLLDVAHLEDGIQAEGCDRMGVELY